MASHNYYHYFYDHHHNLQLIHLSQQFTSNCTNMMTVEGHMKVIIMKDASIQTGTSGGRVFR